MIYQKYIYNLIYLYLCTLLSIVSADEVCDKSRCRGPLKYYEDLACTPIYGSGDSCCPIKYNCNNLIGRSKDKCYFKGHEYAVGESLREEDKRPCDIGCHCSAGWRDAAATFSCAIVDCFQREEPGCYLKNSFGQCCRGPQVCPDKEPNLASCVVDGQTYLDGQTFTPKSDPTLSCICQPGYTGKNEAPFCETVVVTPFSCNVEIRHGNDIYKNCTPGFSNTENPATDCHVFSRCQNARDVVLTSQGEIRPIGTPIADPSSACIFGNLTMNIGEQLNQATDYSSVCLKCVCEVPPIPTCQRLPDAECDITMNPNFG